MSNNAGNHFDNQIILYFFLFTAIIYVSVYLVLNYFGYSFSDVPSNGNVITPLVSAALNQVMGFLSWISDIVNSGPSSWFSFIFSYIPVIGNLYTGLLTIFTAILNAFIALIEQINSFINVWNILNIYVFYILFIPYATITVLIIYDMTMRLLEGLIP